MQVRVRGSFTQIPFWKLRARFRACGYFDGEVAAVSADALWGGMVQIRHPDGYTTSYAGLVLDGSLAAGDTVKAGQQLGTLGEIPAEISQETHLHFALSRDGKAVDPAVLLPDLA